MTSIWEESTISFFDSPSYTFTKECIDEKTHNGSILNFSPTMIPPPSPALSTSSSDKSSSSSRCASISSITSISLQSRTKPISCLKRPDSPAKHVRVHFSHSPSHSSSSSASSSSCKSTPTFSQTTTSTSTFDSDDEDSDFFNYHHHQNNKNKNQSFPPEIKTIYHTYSPREYDRSSVQSSRLGFRDVCELMELKREFQKQNAQAIFQGNFTKKQINDKKQGVYISPEATLSSISKNISKEKMDNLASSLEDKFGYAPGLGFRRGRFVSVKLS